MHGANLQQISVKWGLKDVIIVLLLSILAPLILAALFIYFQIKRDTFLIANYPLLAIVVIGLVYWRVRHCGAKIIDLGLTRDNLRKPIVKGVLYGFFLYAVIILPLYFRNYSKAFSGGKLVSLETFLIAILIFTRLNYIGSILIAPLMEELFDRGFFLQALEKYLRPALCIIIVSLVSTVFHFSIWGNIPLKKFLSIILLNFIFCILFLKYRNLVLNIACHSAVNYLVSFISILSH